MNLFGRMQLHQFPCCGICVFYERPKVLEMEIAMCRCWWHGMCRCPITATGAHGAIGHNVI